MWLCKTFSNFYYCYFIIIIIIIIIVIIIIIIIIIFLSLFKATLFLEAFKLVRLICLGIIFLTLWQNLNHLNHGNLQDF